MNDGDPLGFQELVQMRDRIIVQAEPASFGQSGFPCLLLQSFPGDGIVGNIRRRNLKNFPKSGNFLAKLHEPNQLFSSLGRERLSVLCFSQEELERGDGLSDPQEPSLRTSI